MSELLAKLFLKSTGLKRSIAAFLAAVAAVAPFLPELAPYQDLIIRLGGLFGITGLAHAATAAKD